MERATRSAAETAEILGVDSVATVKRLIDSGDLVKLPIAGKTLVTVASIERLIGSMIEAA